MVKSATEAGSIPTFHYMDEVEVEGLLGLRRMLKDDPALEGMYSFMFLNDFIAVKAPRVCKGMRWRGCWGCAGC
jgi:hypothetical protein